MPLTAGHGFADYLLYVHGKACGVIEARMHAEYGDESALLDLPDWSAGPAVNCFAALV